MLRGRGRFADDIGFPLQLHMRVVRSEHAHGRIVSIDASAARALPGVIAVWTADDIRDLPPIDFRDPAAEALKPYRQYALARERVRYAGEPVAAVFAEDPYLAEDAAGLVAVEVAELPPLMDASAATGEFAPGLDRTGDIGERLWRHRCGVRGGHPYRRTRSLHRPPFRCAAGDARRASALRPRAMCLNSMAPPRCRTARATISRACSGARPNPCISRKAMSAAASESGASFTRKTCWSRPPRFVSGGR